MTPKAYRLSSKLCGGSLICRPNWMHLRICTQFNLNWEVQEAYFSLHADFSCSDTPLKANSFLIYKEIKGELLFVRYLIHTRHCCSNLTFTNSSHSLNHSVR